MKANLVVGVAASAFVVFLGMTMVAADQNRPGQLWDRDDDHDRDARVQAGLKYAREQEIHLNLQHRNREVVGLGSYLVKYFDVNKKFDTSKKVMQLWRQGHT